jgi:hypothetical protein
LLAQRQLAGFCTVGASLGGAAIGVGGIRPSVRCAAIGLCRLRPLLGMFGPIFGLLSPQIRLFRASVGRGQQVC